MGNASQKKLPPLAPITPHASGTSEVAGEQTVRSVVAEDKRAGNLGAKMRQAENLLHFFICQNYGKVRLH